jgi:hypothetical protein
MLDTERFKPIEGYEGRYFISVDGEVYSTPKDGKPAKLLKQEVLTRSSTNYRRVTLSKNGKVKRFQVHRLVANAFIPNPDNKPFVNHIDNNGENNTITNLEWCTHSENMLHAQVQGRLFESQSKGQKAGAKAKRAKADKDATDNYYNKVFGYLQVLPEHHVKELKSGNRLFLHCKCVRDGCTYDKPIYKERHQLTNPKTTLQCPSCACKHGNTGNKGIT